MGKFGAGTMMAVIFATVLGLGGAYAVRQYMQPKEDEVKEEAAPKPPIQVPTVAYDMQPGQRVRFNDIVIRSFKTQEELNKSQYAGKPYMGVTNQIIGRLVKTPLRKGEVFVPDKFYADGEMPGIPVEKLKDGSVATTLPISNLESLKGLLRPGSYVDVNFRSKKPEVTVPLLERVEVLAVGTAVLPAQEVPKDTKTVTVKVSKYQNQALSIVEGQGDLALALRSPDDFNKRETGVKMTLGQLLGLPTGVRMRTMDIYNGGKKATMVFNRQLVTDPRMHIPTPIPENPPALAKKDN